MASPIPGTSPSRPSSPNRQPVPGTRKRPSSHPASDRRRASLRSRRAVVPPGTAASIPGRPLFADDDPDRMDNAGDVAQQRQQDVDPELQPQTDLKEDAERRQQDGQKNTDDIHA